MEPKFIELIIRALEINYSITSETIISELPEWDSLSQLSLIAELDSEYGITIDTKELAGLCTISDLFEEVKKRSANG
jgi:acyl carrier protein